MIEYKRAAQTLTVHGRLEEPQYRDLLTCYGTHPERTIIHGGLRELRDRSLLFITDEELRQLENFARRIRGEIFFARRWMIVEGQGEYLIVHALAHCLGYDLDEHGVALIDSVNNGNPALFAALARALGIPWTAVFDADAAGQGYLNALSARGFDRASLAQRCRTHTAGHLENQLLADGLEPELRSILRALGYNDADTINLPTLQKRLADNKIPYAAQLATRLNGNSALAQRMPQAFRDAMASLRGLTDSPLEMALANLTDIQREAVDWSDGALLVLAGPGSGKTQILTCRIARLLDGARDKNFRILALTFTNKAADEMKDRVAGFVPGLEERANIATFHSFYGQVLRQHGVHRGINPDFAIYALDEDRRAVLEDALRRAAHEGRPVTPDDVRYLSVIDRMKARLIEPKDAEARPLRFEDRRRIALAYQLYEDELRRANALDFNSLIFEAHRLMVAFPATAARYRRSHPYWLIDEFQDTNDAQYRFARAMAGEQFRNVFAVADDDRIIYEWNGASFRQIQRFRADYSSDLIQLPTMYLQPTRRRPTE